MKIEVSNIDDFCTLITTCFLNGIKDIRVFISENIVNEKTKFCYVLFTPLYTAIYSRKVNNEEYQKIYNVLDFCHENNCHHDFRIQVFDKLYFNDETNSLIVGKETNVI